MFSITGIISGSYTLQMTTGGPISDAWVERHFDTQHKENISENVRLKNYGISAIFSSKTAK